MKSLFAGVFALASLALVAPASAATTVVSPSDMDGWATQTDGAASVTFVNGPGAPPLGAGSAQLSVGSNGDDGVQLRNASYAGTKLSDLTQLKYSTYVQDNLNCQAPYLILNVDNDNDGTVDDLLFFEPCYQTGTYGGDPVPNQGDVQLNTWQEWDALAGGWWSLNANTFGPPLTTLASYVAANPDATIVNSDSGAGGVRVVAGYGAGAWDDFVGNVDAVKIGVSGGSDVYDFDPDTPNPPSPTDKDQCKNGGWQQFDPPFKNQGQCVSGVVSQRCKKNAERKKKCAGDQPAHKKHKKAKKPKKKHRNGAKHEGKHGDRD